MGKDTTSLQICEVCQTQNSQLSERGVVVLKRIEFCLVNEWYILVYLIGNEAPWARNVN